MRRKRTKTGVSRFAFLLLALSLLALAGQKPEPAVIAGTVFRDPGFALPGAEVEVVLVSPVQGRKPPKPLRTRTDGRGEFAFQLAPDPAEYKVTARARGYVPEERMVRLSGGPERVDVYLTLKPAGSDKK
ncbi:MAG: carboxypeptidase-like regulatory domain-containing protein [Bryobacteraceae bacterium]